VATLLGQGNGTFLLKSQAATGNKPVSVALGDFNGDGNLDVAVAKLVRQHRECLAGQWRWHAATSSRLPNRPWSLIGYRRRLRRFWKARFAGCQQQDNTATLLLGKGDGTFQSSLTYGLGWMPVALEAVDVNGDGALDVVTADSGGVQPVFSSMPEVARSV